MDELQGQLRRRQVGVPDIAALANDINERCIMTTS